MQNVVDASAFERCSQERRIEVLRRLHAQLAAARQDPEVFITTCAKAEHGAQLPILLAAHQRLLLRFVRHFPMSVVRMPHGSSKTFLLSFLGVWMLGRDLTSRGAIIAAAAQQAQKPLRFLRKQIEKGTFSIVFPELRPSSDPQDVWTASQITVDRPGDLKDASIVAMGIDGKIQGARVSWALADDILDGDNTRTKESRDTVEVDFEANIVSRLDRIGGRCCVTNTPWDRDDLTFRLVERKWPLIAMNVDGFVWFENAGNPMKLFGELIRPSRTQPGRYRLRAHDPDLEEVSTLWPDQMSRAWVEAMRGTRTIPGLMAKTPFDFARFLMCEPNDAGSARCLKEWVDKAFDQGIGMAFPAERTGARPTFTGVDIGGFDKHHDMSSILTFELLSNSKRRILNLQTGHWHGPELLRRISEEAELYDSDIFVESNGAQKFLAEFAQLNNLSSRIKKIDTTGKNKYDETFGVEAVFTEMANELWIWPDGGDAPVNPLLEQLGKECRDYDPGKHTADQLMALFLARQGLTRYRSREARKGQSGAQKRAFTGGGL